MHISLGQDATAFQVEVAAIPDCVTSCTKKDTGKEQIIIFTDSQVAIAALAARGTKSLLVTNCVENLTALLEENQLTIMWAPGHRGIQQNETAGRLVWERVRTRPIGAESFLPLS